MTSQHSRPFDRPGSFFQQPSSLRDSLLERAQQPSVIVPVALVLFTAFYQWLHSSPFARTRTPDELLWDIIVTVTPASLLYTLDSWLNPPLFPVAAAAKSTRPRTHAAKSDLLQKLLGTNKPRGIMSSMATAGLKGLSSLSQSAIGKRRTDQPAGLGNNDNSCFQNSILQGLASLENLPSYLNGATVDKESQPAGPESSATSLRALIAQLKDTQNNGSTLWTPPKLKSLDTFEQQDAQEYYSKLLDEIDNEVARVCKATHKPAGLESLSARDDTEDSQHSDDSGYQSQSNSSRANTEMGMPRNPLEGLSAQRVACVQCGHSEGLSLTPFNCLTLHLAVGQSQHDLYERLDSYTHLESIEGVECGKCSLLKAQRLLQILINRGRAAGSSDEGLREALSRLEAIEQALEEDDFEEKTLQEKCKISKQLRVSSTKTKQAVVARPPRSLTVHINRSVFDERTGDLFKNMADVRFPRTLDLGPWCLGSADGSMLHGDENMATAGAADEERWVMDPTKSMVAGDLQPTKITGPIYELRAVVTHQGRHENGHYVCFRKHPRQPPQLVDVSSAEPVADGDEKEGKPTTAESVLGDEERNDEPGKEDPWWRLSDESVWEVNEDTVLAQGGVFMLFYDCVDPNSVLTSQEDGDNGQGLHSIPEPQESRANIDSLSADQQPGSEKTTSAQDDFVLSLLRRPNS